MSVKQLDDPYYYGKGKKPFVHRLADFLIWLSVAAFIVWLFSSCYTPKKAGRQLAKANYKFPVMVAKKTRELYPCTTTKIERTTDSAAYNLWKDSVSKTAAFYEALMASTEPEIITDTVVDEKVAARLKSDNEKLKGIIRQLNYNLSTVPPIYIKEKEKVEDSAKILLVTAEMADQRAKFDKSISDSSALISKQRLTIMELQEKNKKKGKVILWLGIALAVVVGLGVYLLKRR